MAHGVEAEEQTRRWYPPELTWRPAVTTDEPGSQASDAEIPGGLHARGTQLWLALGQPIGTPAGQLALEACRTADRLDELDNVIAGKGVLNLLRFRTSDREWWDGDGTEHVQITVTFSGVLAEARQQQTTFRTLLAGLEVKGAADKPTEGASPLAQVLALVQPGAKPAGRTS